MIWCILVTILSRVWAFCMGGERKGEEYLTMESTVPF